MTISSLGSHDPGQKSRSTGQDYADARGALTPRLAPGITVSRARVRNPARHTPLIGISTNTPISAYLCNYEMDSENRLCVLLVGLTELRRRLAMAVHESLSQRLVVRHHLTGLDRDELDHYLTHRLRLAGCEIPLFEPPRSRRCSRARAVCHDSSTASPTTPDRRRRQRRPYRQRRAPRTRRRRATAMNLPNLPYLLVPHELSDEAAAHVSELLNDLAVAFDGQYFAQVRRYYDERRDIERFCHDGQLDLFDYDDVEF